jgi:hypothetical protein
MKEIVSKSVSPDWVKNRKKDKAKIVQYWSCLRPKEYAIDMVRDYGSKPTPTERGT